MSNSLRPHGLQRARLFITNSWSLLKLMSIELVIPSDHLIPLLFPSPPAFNLSQHQGLFHESVLRIRWPKYWSFSFSVSPSSEYSGLISFRIDWLDLLAVQGTCTSLLQHHSSKISILWCSVFFMAQLSHPCTTTGKTIAFQYTASNPFQNCIGVLEIVGTPIWICCNHTCVFNQYLKA